MTYTYDYNFDAGGFIGSILAFLGIILLIGLVIAIIVLIAQAKAYKKAGEEGWKVLIPFYNQYVLCKIVGVNPMWIVISILSFLLSEIPLVGIVTFVANIYFTILLNVSTAKAYGKDVGFAIGLIFLPFIFWPILGFGKAEFTGQDPMTDIIFKNQTVETKVVPQTTNNQPTETNAQAVAYCPNCGQAFSSDSMFCSNCGTKRN